MIKFKDLPKEEQEGYVLAYTDRLKVKAYMLCYLHVDKALEKLTADDEEFFKINTTVTRYDGQLRFEESIVAKSKEVIPIVERLINEGRFFSDNRDYQTLFEMVEDETWAFRNIPESFITDVLVEFYVEHNKRPTIMFFPEKHMTAERFIKLSKKDYNAASRMHKYIHLLSDDDLLHLLCSDIREMPLNIPTERWTKELLYGYLEHCVHNNKEPGFVDIRANKGVPTELKDKVFHQCCCMLGGFYYSRIPFEMQETVISKKLIAETIRRWDLFHQEGTSMHYNGLGWMLQCLPQKFVTIEVCTEVCQRYPYAISHVPDEIIKDENFWKDVLESGCLTPLTALDDKRVRLLPKNYLNLRAEAQKKEKLKIGEIKGKIQEDEWESILRQYGARVYDVPKELLTLDLLLIAMRSNAYCIEKDLSILKSLASIEVKQFWETVVAEKLFQSPVSVPDEFMTEEAVMDWVEKSYGYEAKAISKTFQTDKVLLKIANVHPDRFEFPMEVQTQELVDTIMSLQTKDICKAMILRKVRPDLRRAELVDELCLIEPHEILSLSTVTKEQIHLILKHFPHLIVNAPMWYIMDLRKKNNSDVETVVAKNSTEKLSNSSLDTHTNELLKTLVEEPSWTQLSLFDFMAS